MKVAVLVIACLIVGACAQETTTAKPDKPTDFLSQLKNALQGTVDHVKEHGKNVLTGLVGQLQQSGSQLLQSTLLKLLEQLGTQAPGKRDLANIQGIRDMLQKFLELMKAKKQEAKGLMAKGLSKLEAVIEKISNMSFLKQRIGKTEKQIDDAVAHHVTVTRRFLGDLGDKLLNVLKETGSQALQKLLVTVVGSLNGVNKRFIEGLVDVSSLVDVVKDLGKKLLTDLVNQGLTAVVGAAGKKRFLVDNLVDTLKEVGTNLLNQLLTTVVGSVAGQLGKRELHPLLQGLVDFFKPHVQTVVGSVKGLGETLKGHANNLWNTVQTHAGQLQGKLQGHVDELKQHGKTLLGHGKTAVDALKTAVTDILSQTLTNANGTLTQAAKTVGEAGKVVSGHVAGTLGSQ